ncbi:MAG: DUF4254 domain-containing protein [Acidobacteriaceae bacterium]
MLSALHIVSLQDEHTALWHGPAATAPAQPEDALDALVVEQHRANFELWHEEDRARTPGASDAVIAAVKRTIDCTNQRRNDLAEEIDSLLLAKLEADGPTNATAELHSETPGLMIDRLSILSLKLFHTREELARSDAPEGHGERNMARLHILAQQRDDLAECLDRLWQQVCAGRRRFKLYRQLKMYNDLALNPAMYRADSGAGDGAPDDPLTAG